MSADFSDHTGDTSLIRGYGESRVNGKPVSQAWCEAVVPRLPEYIDSEDAPEKWPRTTEGSPAVVHNPRADPDLSPLNRKFGRRFDIISSGWLSPTIDRHPHAPPVAHFHGFLCLAAGCGVRR